MQGRPTNHPGKAGRALPAASPRAAGNADAHLLRPGAMLGRYELVVRLARGDATEIWLTKGHGAQGAAVKALRVDIPQTPELVASFVREATIAAKLHHPNIVQLTDCGRIGARHYMAMEHIDGMSLGQLAQRLGAHQGRLPLGLLARLLQQVCVALHHGHELSDDKGWLGFLHRDVCPDNVLVSAQGVAKLADFGAARMRSLPDNVAPKTVRNRYASPERVQGLGEDRRSDVYSVGVMLYELATGTPPFQGSELEVISAIVAGQPRDPRELVPDLPEAIASIIRRAMAPRAADRYPNALAMSSDLQAFVDARGDGANLETLLGALFDAPVEYERVPTPAPITETTTKVVMVVAEPEPEPESRERFAPDADFSNDDITRPTVMVLPDRIVDTAPPRPPDPPPPAPAPPAPAWVADRKESLSKAPADIFATHRRETGSGSFAVSALGGDAPTPDVFSMYGRAERQTPPERPVVTERPWTPERRAPANPAAQRFDRGLELLAAKLYEQALAEWEEACRLDPGNRVYQTNLKRLRARIPAPASGQTTETE